ncbi:hypothetical protein KP509_35G006900 [Ceratopteris richardii]|uniref:Cytochrome P450 n=1 Tax=Ceratopteris richardii TaxID=49495 RepID=A0A8T2QDP4_CERRI|nr:hypothetical protein KP509_35G006900 [Ceratopteris richardii]
MEEGRLEARDVMWVLSITLIGGAFCHYMVQRWRSTRGRPTNWPVLGMLPAMLINLDHIHDWVASLLISNSGTFLFQGPWFSDMRYLYTADPRNIEHALRTNFDDYPKGKGFSDIFLDLLGQGIFNTDGELWRIHRKVTSLQLNSRLCREFSDSAIFSMVENKLLPLLDCFCKEGLRFDLQDILLRLTFDTICLVGFGEEVGCLSPELPVSAFAKAFETTLECTMFRFFLPLRWWQTLRRLRLGKERDMPEAMRVVDRFFEELVASRRRVQNDDEHCERKYDLMSCLLMNGGEMYMDDKLLRDSALNLLLAGRDTSAQALCWFFWLVAQHPSVESKIVEETRRIVGGAMGNGKSSLTRRELKQMHYLHAALTESLRLYPSVPFDFKNVRKDDILPDGTRMKKNDRFVYAIHAMGRMESIWGKDSLCFRPERWLNSCDGTFTDTHVPAFHYVVFNGGPRTCLGKDMAYVLMKAVASSILFHFSVRLVPGHIVTPRLSITLYMKDGLAVTLARRNLQLNP